MRVLIVHSGLILTAGIEDILARQKNLIVKGISSQEYSAVLREIAVFRPGILILDERPKPGDLTVLFERLKGDPNPKIICVNKHNNRIVIYEKTEIEVTRASDLIEIIGSQQRPFYNAAEATRSDRV
jgi:hypothetical protein